MAQMRTLSPVLSFGGRPLKEIADVGMAVGKGRENNVSDVQLVQFLLQFTIEDLKASKSRLGPLRDSRGREIGGITVDGIFGPATREAVAAFQRSINRALESKHGVVADGVVSPTRGSPTSTDSGSLFTIVWLNQIRRAVTGSDFDADSILIEPLRSSLLASVGDGQFA